MLVLATTLAASSGLSPHLHLCCCCSACPLSHPYTSAAHNEVTNRGAGQVHVSCELCASSSSAAYCGRPSSTCVRGSTTLISLSASFGMPTLRRSLAILAARPRCTRVCRMSRRMIRRLPLMRQDTPAPSLSMSWLLGPSRFSETVHPHSTLGTRACE